MLLDPLEKQFNLPALVIDGGNGWRRNLKVVGEKDEPLIDIGGEETDSAKQVRKLCSGAIAVQQDGLVTAHAGGAINRMRLPAAKSKVVFGANHEVGECAMEMEQARKIDIAAVHHDEASGFGNDAIQNVRITRVSACNVDQHGDCGLNVQQRTHLHCSSGAFVGRPGKQRQTQFNDGRVQGIESAVQIQPLNPRPDRVAALVESDAERSRSRFASLAFRSHPQGWIVLQQIEILHGRVGPDVRRG